MVLLSSILQSPIHQHPLLVLQSSLAQNCLPVLSHILSQDANPARNIRSVLLCFLYPPSTLAGELSPSNVEVHDWTDRIPGYYETKDTLSDLLAVVDKALQNTSQPTSIIIDSIDTILSDQGSLQGTYKCLYALMNLVKKHKKSRLILHSQAPSELLPLVAQTTFSSSLVHVIAHPSVLLNHIATEFLMPPPPVSPGPKFWSVFIPVSARLHDTENLVFGTKGEGSGSISEFVTELIVRDANGRKREVERVLAAWSSDSGPCELENLPSLAHLWKKQTDTSQVTSDPTKNLSFNLTLTAAQQESRATVPLPYTLEEQAVSQPVPGAIYYDPDSADDIDDDDPDEDLDI